MRKMSKRERGLTDPRISQGCPCRLSQGTLSALWSCDAAAAVDVAAAAAAAENVDFFC